MAWVVAAVAVAAEEYLALHTPEAPSSIRCHSDQVEFAR
jgi:hypothetical protein